MHESFKTKYHLTPLDPTNVQRLEQSFDICIPMALMQQGLPAAYDYADILYVTDEPTNKDKLTTLGQTNFRKELSAILINNFKDYIPSTQRIINIPEIPQLLISTFDTELWNRLSQSSVNVYKPAWNDPQRSSIIHPNFS